MTAAISGLSGGGKENKSCSNFIYIVIENRNITRNRAHII